MKIKVHMLAFMDGEIREVDVPGLDRQDGKWLMQGKPVDEKTVCDAVFHFGQNDFSPSPDTPSVSAADVVELDGRFHRIDNTGFTLFRNETCFMAYCREPRIGRIMAAMGD